MIPPIDPTVGAALVSAGGGVLSGLLGSFGSRYAAKQALKAQRETNAMNYKIWQEQLAWNRENYQQQVDDQWAMYNQQNADARANWQYQFDTTNAYNDPSAQVARFEQAGLNPFLMMNGQGSIASGGSFSSPSMSPPGINSPGMPTMQMPSPEAYVSPLMSGLQQGFASAMNLVDIFSGLVESENVITDTAGKKLQNEFDAKKMPLALAGLSLDNKNKQADYDNKLLTGEGLSLDNQYNRETMQTRHDALTLANDYARTQIALSRLSVQQQEIVTKYFEMNQVVKLQQEIQNLANSVAEGHLKRKQAEHLASSIALNYAKVKTESTIQALNTANAGKALQETQNLQQQYNINAPNEVQAITLANQMYEDKAIIEDIAKSMLNNQVLQQQLDESQLKGEIYSSDRKQFLRQGWGGRNPINWLYDIADPIKGIFSGSVGFSRKF